MNNLKVFIKNKVKKQKFKSISNGTYKNTVKFITQKCDCHSSSFTEFLKLKNKTHSTYKILTEVNTI